MKNIRLKFNILSRVSRATFFLFLLAFSAQAQGPSWWYARGAVNTNLSASDYAPINLGQLKWLALNAYYEMESYFGAGSNVTAAVSAFPITTNYLPSAAHGYPATIGQLKYVAQPFYDRLYELNLTNTFPANMPGYYPWGQAPATNDFALANIGQAKYVFSFDSAVDSDADGLSDWDEVTRGTNPYDPDSDDDGLNDQDEVARGTNAKNVDTDGDGLSDGWEVQKGWNPLDPSDADPAEVVALRERARSRIIHYSILYFGQPPVFSNPPGSAADLNDMAAALNALSGKFYKMGN